MKYSVTIGIPVYNAEKYIGRAIESALAQVFPDYEILVYNDGCSDSSITIIEEYQRTHPRGNIIHIIHCSENKGVGFARNRIIDEAKGHFLYFMDSDDIIEPNTIALLMEHQQRVGADIVFGSYDKTETYNENCVVEVKQYKYQVFEDEDSFAIFSNSRYGMLQSSVCNFCVNLEMLRQSGLRFLDVNFWEDMAFMFELPIYCKRAVMLPSITYHYLCRYDSLSNYQQREHICKDEVLCSIRVADYMKQQCIKQPNKSYYPSHCYIAVMTSFYIVCHILKNQAKISSGFSASDLKSIMTHPVGMRNILCFSSMRWPNLFLFILGKLPSKIMVWLFRVIGRKRGLI